jgi:hypothetical protein
LEKPDTAANDSRADEILRMRASDPVRATEALTELLRKWVEIIARPDIEPELAAIGLTSKHAATATLLIGRTLEDLNRGRDEAESIRLHLERQGLEGLQSYLKANPITPEGVAWLLFENRRLALSLAASAAAKKRNADPRTWVVEVWKDRVDKGQSKASFARMIEHEVRRRFGVGVTADRIARYWLPKG